MKTRLLVLLSLNDFCSRAQLLEAFTWLLPERDHFLTKDSRIQFAIALTKRAALTYLYVQLHIVRIIASIGDLTSTRQATNHSGYWLFTPKPDTTCS